MTMEKHELKVVKFKIQRASVHLSNIAADGDASSQQAAEEALRILNDVQFKIGSLTAPQKMACSHT